MKCLMQIASISSVWLATGSKRLSTVEESVQELVFC